jgi:hypothetical protein
MSSSLLRGLLLGAIAAGKVISILAKKRNRLIVQMPNVLDPQNPTATTINFDIVKTWSYKNSVRLTQNPVEQGVNINDHRIIEPMHLTIEVGVSNVVNPLNSLTSTSNVLQASKLLFTAGFSLANSPMEATYSMLKAAISNSEPFEIISPLGKLKNFVITSIESSNNSSNYGAFEGTIELQEVLFFETIANKTNLSGVKNPTTNVGTLTQKYSKLGI